MADSNIEIAEQIPASRKLGADAARELLAGSDRLIVAKGKKITEFDEMSLADDAALTAMLGPTGNLRAPTVRSGKTVLVGFNEAVYGEVLNP